MSAGVTEKNKEIHGGFCGLAQEFSMRIAVAHTVVYEYLCACTSRGRHSNLTVAGTGVTDANVFGRVGSGRTVG